MFCSYSGISVVAENELKGVGGFNRGLLDRAILVGYACSQLGVQAVEFTSTLGTCRFPSPSWNSSWRESSVTEDGHILCHVCQGSECLRWFPRLAKSLSQEGQGLKVAFLSMLRC